MPGRHTPTSKFRLVVAIAAIVVVATVGVVAGAHAHHQTPQNARDRISEGGPYSGGGEGAAPTGDPYGIGGKEMDLSSATAAATFSVDVPSAELAASSNVTGVWEATYRRDDSQVVLQYDSGKLWIYENPLADPDPKSVLARYEGEMTTMSQQVSRQVFSIEYIGSTPLLVAQPNTDSDQTNPASVEFARGDIDVQLLSHSYTTDQLIQVAKTMVG